MLTGVVWLAPLAAAQPGVPKMTSPLYGGGREIGETSNGMPPALKETKIEQKLGDQIPLDLTFRDEAGASVQLKQYFNQRPVIVTLVYYDCPMLCNQVLNALTGALKAVPFAVGKDFDIVTVSFDPKETPELAARKKQVYLEDLKQPGAGAGWHFLTGDAAAIEKITDAVGFRYAYDEATKQFAHASGIMVATPEGKLSHYFYGIEYAPKEVRLSLVEASQNQIGSPVDQLLLYCYHYDPATGKYGPVVMNIVRVCGVLTIIGIGLMLLLLRKRLINPALRDAGGGAA
ncbi:MAG TPA: SCO family protein [Pyrinomonadaceae bacterium]|nr:SCO family protein [Pyrinomonadaceae bacterium]